GRRGIDEAVAVARVRHRTDALRRCGEAIYDVARVEIRMRGTHERDDARDDRGCAARARPLEVATSRPGAHEILARCTDRDGDALRRGVEARDAVAVDAS